MLSHRGHAAGRPVWKTTRRRVNHEQHARDHEHTLARARAGDDATFSELTDAYRREFQLHVYRIVGSVQDAEDLLQ
jgi:hypothetical protein